MNAEDLKEKIIVFGVMTGVFLPVRLVFYTFVSKYWLGSVGLISLVAILMYVMTTKSKLGRFGILYQKQMGKFSKGKLGKSAICGSIIVLILFGISPSQIEKANSTYVEEKDFYVKIAKLALDYVITGKPQEFTGEIPYAQFENSNLTFIQKIEQSFSVSLGIVNDLTNGWALHFYTVGFVSELEFLGLICFYRYGYNPRKLS